MIESQDFIVNRIRDLGRPPKLIEFCDPDPGENEYELRDILVFVNGYRSGSPVELYNLSPDEFRSQIEQGQQARLDNVFFADVLAYWNLNGQFKNRLQPETTLYVDGHNAIETSNHETTPKFLASLASARAGGRFGIIHFNDTPNEKGFIIRKTAGERAGDEIFNMIIDRRIPTTRTGNKIDQKIDIVAHSFGYAHALGLYESIKRRTQESNIEIDFDRFYILAPENAGTMTGTNEHLAFTFPDFDQVWQYGSARDRPRPLPTEDQPRHQDGVAVQRGIIGLSEFGELPENLTSYGRSFIPDDNNIPRGFTQSHFESNYLWMFTRLTNNNQRGYINPK